jgi:dTMP kinase
VRASGAALSGRFVTLEGGEGAGKSTLLAALRERLERAGFTVVATREPGGSPGAEIVRRVILSGAAAPLGPFAEAVLFAAARDDHLEQVIRPALARGAVVLCDRFADSTRAYQGAVGGVEPSVLAALDRVVVGRTRPDLTLVLDVAPEVGLARARRRQGEPDRFEKEGPGFHAKLRQAFLEIARREPGRCVVLDAETPADVLAQQAYRIVTERLGSRSAEAVA